MANLLLDLADKLGLSMTHMALHKIAYFAHGWRLALDRGPLVKQQFEAWKYGPVLGSVYQSFKNAGSKPITTRATGIDPITDHSFVVTEEFSDKDIDLLQSILQAYGRKSALELSDLTHKAGGPWDQVWNAPAGKINLGMRISNEAIRLDFLAGQIDRTVGAS